MVLRYSHTQIVWARDIDSCRLFQSTVILYHLLVLEFTWANSQKLATQTYIYDRDWRNITIAVVPFGLNMPTATTKALSLTLFQLHSLSVANQCYAHKPEWHKVTCVYGLYECECANTSLLLRTILPMFHSTAVFSSDSRNGSMLCKQRALEQQTSPSSPPHLPNLSFFVTPAGLHPAFLISLPFNFRSFPVCFSFC